MRLIELDGHEYFEVGSRRVPVADSFREDHELGHAHLTSDGWMRARGCLVKFETGWAVSVIWGNFTYSSNRSPSFFDYDSCPEWSEEPTLVEIMVLNHKRESADEEQVLGWVTERELTNLFDILSDLPTNATFSYSTIRKEYE